MLHPIRSLSKRLTRLRRFPVVADRRGATFVLDPRNWIDNRLLARAPFEEKQIARAHELVTAYRLDTFLDVGANIGLYTVLLGRMPEIKQVHAFEPVARNFNQLCGNVFANRLDSKVEAHRLAASNTTGCATIHIDPASTGVSRLALSGTSRDTRVFRETETVSLGRIDDVLNLSDRRLFIKVDVEGHALPALEGMRNLLANNDSVVQVELHEADREGIIRLLAGAGLVLIGEIDGDGYFIRPGRE